jgi:hypothetical protein
LDQQQFLDLPAPPSHFDFLFDLDSRAEELVYPVHVLQDAHLLALALHPAHQVQLAAPPSPQQQPRKGVHKFHIKHTIKDHLSLSLTFTNLLIVFQESSYKIILQTYK